MSWAASGLRVGVAVMLEGVKSRPDLCGKSGVIMALLALGDGQAHTHAKVNQSKETKPDRQQDTHTHTHTHTHTTYIAHTTLRSKSAGLGACR